MSQRIFKNRYGLGGGISASGRISGDEGNGKCTRVGKQMTGEGSNFRRRCITEIPDGLGNGTGSSCRCIVKQDLAILAEGILNGECGLWF